MFTAVVATRAIFGFCWRPSSSVKTSSWAQAGACVQVRLGRSLALVVAISTIPVGIGLIWLSIFGLNLGLDFTSGTRISASLERPASVESVRATVSNAGYKDATVQTTTQTVRGKTVDGIQIETTALDPTQQAKLRERWNPPTGSTPPRTTSTRSGRHSAER